MKKNIGYVTLNPSTARWLQNNLPEGELRQGIRDLLTQACSTLMVELEDTETPFPEETGLHCEALWIDEKSRRVVRDGVEIALTPKEFDILAFLARNRGEVFTKEQIYRAVWDGTYLLDDSNIMAFIRKIRKKIEPNPDAPLYVLTIWGIGYKFNDQI
ncbi:winged helix-turn-helix transcriptional regulator [Gemmiger formicilis]|uniref:winged helix-turn-helix domain-containing protein n=1 Tax=Gemmiger formicilis TaxID=745368 RepID=UPI001956631C|nr:winged helix-turn-helix domain-containing protein [Gemmiger formicilis]MBM6900265.1 winged helix-turn-helix transcriptional regulator [Gemmiger formicilis]